MPNLVILSPDSAYGQVLPAILKRHQSLGIRAISVEVISDPFHDSSGQIVELLRPYLNSGCKALVVQDLEGSGKENVGTEALEAALQEDLRRNGWSDDNSAALVLEPEIESWLKLRSAHMDELIRQRARRRKEELHDWKAIADRLAGELGGWGQNGKHPRPKEVYQGVLRHFGISPSNALLGALAEKESLVGCLVPSFNRFHEIVRRWFPAF